MTEVSNVDSGPRPLYTVSQFAERHKAFPQAAQRALILNAAPRQNSRGEEVPGNGLEKSGAILRIGRRVLIDEQRFFFWIADE